MQVLSWEALGSDSGVRIVTDKGTYEADKLVLSAGAWMPKLVPELQVGGDSLLDTQLMLCNSDMLSSCLTA